jgi:hypothetical protein
MTARAYRLAPIASRQRGLPAIGVEMVAPGDVELTPIGKGPAIVRCCERAADGRTIGELEVSVFSAALIIDRDGILEEKARDIAEDAARVAVSATSAVSLPGASGYRADVEIRGAVRPPLPYVHAFAMAPEAGIDGGLVVTVRSAGPHWPAADAILASLKILTRHGTAPPANDGDDVLRLPVVSKSPREP